LDKTGKVFSTLFRKTNPLGHFHRTGSLYISQFLRQRHFSSLGFGGHNWFPKRGKTILRAKTLFKENYFSRGHTFLENLLHVGGNKIFTLLKQRAPDKFFSHGLSTQGATFPSSQRFKSPPQKRGFFSPRGKPPPFLTWVPRNNTLGFGAALHITRGLRKPFLLQKCLFLLFRNFPRKRFFLLNSPQSLSGALAQKFSPQNSAGRFHHSFGCSPLLQAHLQTSPIRGVSTSPTKIPGHALFENYPGASRETPEFWHPHVHTGGRYNHNNAARQHFSGARTSIFSRNLSRHVGNICCPLSSQAETPGGLLPNHFHSLSRAGTYITGPNTTGHISQYEGDHDSCDNKTPSRGPTIYTPPTNVSPRYARREKLPNTITTARQTIPHKLCGREKQALSSTQPSLGGRYKTARTTLR